MRWILFYIFTALFVLIVVMTMATVFFGIGEPTENERDVLFKTFIVEIGLAVATLFYSLFGLKKQRNPEHHEFEGDWWQYALTVNRDIERSVVSILHTRRDEDGQLSMNGDAWGRNGKRFARFNSRATKILDDKLIYYWEGDWPETGEKLFGPGEIVLKTSDRAEGEYITRSETNLDTNVLSSVLYFRAEPGDYELMQNAASKERADLLTKRLKAREALLAR
ncbi:MAG: hypothetical protein GY931_13455 [Maribacter sp.]|nr:hypothetical protein [Maribacter sp.]